MDNVKDDIALANLTAIEACFELDPFDREAQKDFEDAIDNLFIKCYH